MASKTGVFAVIACNLAILEGWNLHFQAPVNFTLSSAVNKSQWHQKIPEKNSLEHQESNPGCWVRSKNATSVLCWPLASKIFYPIALVSFLRDPEWRRKKWSCPNHFQIELNQLKYPFQVCREKIVGEKERWEAERESWDRERERDREKAKKKREVRTETVCGWGQDWERNHEWTWTKIKWEWTRKRERRERVCDGKMF